MHFVCFQKNLIKAKFDLIKSLFSGLGGKGMYDLPSLIVYKIVKHSYIHTYIDSMRGKFFQTLEFKTKETFAYIFQLSFALKNKKMFIK